MDLCAGVFCAIWLGVTIPTHVDTLNITEITALEPKKVNCTAEEENVLNSAEFDLLARCVESEAGDQDFEGICYVVDVILNRAEQWNLSITEVIYQKTARGYYQFDVVNNGRINTAKPSEKTLQAIEQELKGRLNTEILYFCMYRWFDSWAEYCFTHPKDRPNNCHHFYKEKR